MFANFFTSDRFPVRIYLRSSLFSLMMFINIDMENNSVHEIFASPFTGGESLSAKSGGDVHKHERGVIYIYADTNVVSSRNPQTPFSDVILL